MATSVNSYGNNSFYGCSNIKRIVFPENIKSVSNFGNNMLNGSSVQHIVFLGISSIDTIYNTIISTKCFGLNKSCLIQLNGSVIYRYDITSQSITTYNSNIFEYGQKIVTQEQTTDAFNITEGKKAKFQVNKLYRYTADLAGVFLPYNGTEKTQKLAMPIMIFYIDSKKSTKSMEFIDDILKNENFSNSIKNITETPNCMYMVYDRANPGGEPDRNHFKEQIKDKIKDKNLKITSFPCVILQWKGNFKVQSFEGVNI